MDVENTKLKPNLVLTEFFFIHFKIKKISISKLLQLGKLCDVLPTNDG